MEAIEKRAVAERDLSIDFCWSYCKTIKDSSCVAWSQFPFSTVCHHTGLAGRIDYADGRSEKIPDGGVFIVPADMTYRIAMDVNRPFTARAVAATARLFSSMDVYDHLIPPLVLMPPFARTIRGVLDDIIDCTPDKFSHPLLFIAERSALLHRMFAAILSRSAVSTAVRPVASLERIEPALRYIQENIGRKINRSEIADVLGVSAPRLHVLFRQAMKLSPMDYVMKLRIDTAKKILVRDNSGLTAVAQRSGFPNQYDFSRVFRKKCGIPPRAYRERYRTLLPQHTDRKAREARDTK